MLHPQLDTVGKLIFGLLAATRLAFLVWWQVGRSPTCHHTPFLCEAPQALRSQAVS